MLGKTLTSMVGAAFFTMEVAGVAGSIEGVLTAGTIITCGIAIVTTSGMSRKKKSKNVLNI